MHFITVLKCMPGIVIYCSEVVNSVAILLYMSMSCVSLSLTV